MPADEDAVELHASAFSLTYTARTDVLLKRQRNAPNASAADEKPLPSTVTGVPPSDAPRTGHTDDTAAAGRYVKNAPLHANCCPLADRPSRRAPAADDGGDAHSSWCALTIRAVAVAPLPSKRHRNVADSRKPLPNTATRLPPDTGPAGGTSALVCSAGCTYRLLPLRSVVPCTSSSTLDQPVGSAGGDTQRTPSGP